MARQEINLGALPNGVGGDTPRVANTKINDMTEELYAAVEEGGGKVQTVAGVEADAGKDIPKAQLATALGVDDKVDKEVMDTALGNKVDKVAGKGLSSNDFTTTEKTKLSTLVNPAAYGVGGPAPLVDNIYQVKDGGITYWNQATTGRPPTGGQGNLISMTGGLNGSASTFIATSLDEDKVFFSRVNGVTRAPWKQFLLSGDYGLTDTLKRSPNGTNIDNLPNYTQKVWITPDGGSGGPLAGQHWIVEHTVLTDTGYALQQAQCLDSVHPGIYTRTQLAGVWSSWIPSGIQTITNANGTAVKFPDGTAICWFTKGPTITTGTAIGSGFQSAAATRYTYPISFVGAAESISVAPHVVYVSGSSQAWCTLSSKTATYCDVIALGFQSGIEVRTGFLAIGRWKV